MSGHTDVKVMDAEHCMRSSSRNRGQGVGSPTSQGGTREPVLPVTRHATTTAIEAKLMLGQVATIVEGKLVERVRPPGKVYERINSLAALAARMHDDMALLKAKKSDAEITQGEYEAQKRTWYVQFKAVDEVRRRFQPWVSDVIFLHKQRNEPAHPAVAEKLTDDDCKELAKIAFVSEPEAYTRATAALQNLAKARRMIAEGSL